MRVLHTLKPVYDLESKILILGSMPSVKSREIGFYYGHPKNRFWQTLESIYDEKIENNNKAKENFLLKHHIALFDVIKSCDIESSSDSTIKNIVPNDLTDIIKNSKIDTIFTTGQKAYKLYQKYCYPVVKIEAIPLPSTSPANCKKGIEEELKKTYSIVKKYTN